MSHIFETRVVAANLRDAVGVARVACIGDSMMYGFGGPARDAFPAHLGRILNAAYPSHFIFVDNFGHTSGNVWKSWPQFVTRAERARFDAVIFSICQNDMELFELNSARYGAEKRSKTYDDGTPTWAAGTDLLNDIAVWRERTKADVLIMFYTYHAGDRPLVDKAQIKCEQFGIPFVDMLKFFQQNTALSASTYAVSEFDGHPSSMAHEMAARHVVREMRARDFLGNAPAAANGGKAALVRAGELMILQGIRPDDVASWMLEVGEIKANAARRQSAGNRSKDSYPDWTACIELAKECLSHWRTGLRRQLRSHALEVKSREFEAYYANLASHRRNFEEMLYVLLHAGPQTEAATVVALFSDGAHRKDGKLPEFGVDFGTAACAARQQMDALKTRMGLNEFPPGDAGFLAPVQGVLGLDSSTGLESALAQELFFMDRHVQLLQSYARSIAPSLQPGTPLHDLVSILMISWRSFSVYADRLTKQADDAVSLSAPHGLPRTAVNVTVEGAVGATLQDRYFDLAVSFVYEIPRRGIVRERQNAGATKERFNYHFEFPLMLKGSIVVEAPRGGVNLALFEEGKARFTNIEIANPDWNMKIPDGAKVVRWKNSGEATTTVTLNNVLLA